MENVVSRVLAKIVDNYLLKYFQQS